MGLRALPNVRLVRALQCSSSVRAAFGAKPHEYMRAARTSVNSVIPWCDCRSALRGATGYLPVRRVEHVRSPSPTSSAVRGSRAVAKTSAESVDTVEKAGRALVEPVDNPLRALSVHMPLAIIATPSDRSRKPLVALIFAFRRRIRTVCRYLPAQIPRAPSRSH